MHSRTRVAPTTAALVLATATGAIVLAFGSAAAASSAAGPSTTATTTATTTPVTTKAPPTTKAAPVTTTYAPTTVATTAPTTKAAPVTTAKAPTTTAAPATTAAPVTTAAKGASGGAGSGTKSSTTVATLDPGTEALPAEAQNVPPRLLVDGGPDAEPPGARSWLSPMLKLRLVAVGAGLVGLFVLVLTIRYLRRTKPHAPSEVGHAAPVRATAPRADLDATTVTPAAARAPVRPRPPARRAPATPPARADGGPWTPKAPRWGESRLHVRPPGQLPAAASQPRPVFASAIDDDRDRTEENRVPTLL